MRLIDADALIDVVDGDLTDSLAEGKCIEKIMDAPTIDAVQVVRCAECKWFQCNMRMDGYLPKGVDEFECRHWCGSCDPVDFCSYGEREENG